MQELIVIERKMINAKFYNKKIKYWWYRRKYRKLKKWYNNRGEI